MNRLDDLARDVRDARRRYLDSVTSLTAEQGRFRPAPEAWSAAEITEHLVIAEQGGVCGMWNALDRVRRGKPWRGEHIHRGRSIEEVVEETWGSVQEAPEGATPRWGGPLGFWIAALESCQPLLDRLQDELEGVDLEEVIHPHPISGPLDARQRFEFLRFHLDRHRAQVERLRAQDGFPEGGERRITDTVEQHVTEKGSDR